MSVKISALVRGIFCALFALLVNVAIAQRLHGSIASGVYAASHPAIDQPSAYALGFLLTVVVGLSAYLTMVIIYPERF